MKTIIVAYDQRRGIGAKNDLLWKHDLPADLRHFKETTMNGAIIMGRNTFNSIGRALPGRHNIVIMHGLDLISDVTIAHSLEEAYDAAASDPEIFIIGGAQIYAQAINTVDRIIATEVEASFANADTFFPVIDKALWQETSRTHHASDERNLYAYDFVTYDRK